MFHLTEKKSTAFAVFLFMMGCASHKAELFKSYANPSDFRNGVIGFEDIYVESCKDTLMVRTSVVEAPTRAECHSGSDANGKSARHSDSDSWFNKGNSAYQRHRRELYQQPFVYYNMPAQDLYHLEHRFVTEKPMQIEVQGFEVASDDSLLVSKTYAAPPSVFPSSYNDFIYCDMDGCRDKIEAHFAKGACKTDTSIGISVSGKFQLPRLKSVMLRERIHLKNGFCDTVLVHSMKLLFLETGMYKMML